MADINLKSNKPLREVNINGQNVDFQLINAAVLPRDDEDIIYRKTHPLPVDVGDVRLFQTILMGQVDDEGQPIEGTSFIYDDFMDGKQEQLNKTFATKMRFISATTPAAGKEIDKMGWFILSN